MRLQQQTRETTKKKRKLLSLTAVRIKTVLLSALETYNPCPAAGDVGRMKNPVANPMKVPDLKLSIFAKVSVFISIFNEDRI